MAPDLCAPALTFIFDGSCDFCTRCARWLRALDRRGRIKLVPFQGAGVPESAGLTVAQCEAAAWAYTPAGERYRGAEAVNVALVIVSGLKLPLQIYRLPVMRQLQDWVYAVITRNRHRLPGDRPYCEQHPEACR